MSGSAVVIVGAGPAGLIAADVLSAHGVKVRLYDQRRSPGRKFTLAGRGGLNLTHSEPLEEMLDRYGPQRRLLEPAIRAFDASDLRAWSADLGEPTIVGTSGRVFPESFRATPLLRALMQRLDQQGVEFNFHHRLTAWKKNADEHVLTFEASEPTVNAHTVTAQADIVLFALGGPSWPRVSSDGSWLSLFSDAGVACAPWAPANCGLNVEWSDVLIERFAGSPLKNVAVSFHGETVRGDPMITRTGLEGGPIYAHSRAVREALGDGDTQIELDLFPDLTPAQLHERLEHKLRRKDSLSSYLRRKGLDKAKIAVVRDATGNEIDRTPLPLSRLLKAVPVEIVGTSSLDRSISAAGGISFDAIDDHFMLTEFPGAFVSGEMIDWEAPTGGYLLQATFATAVHAANAILARLAH